MFKILIDTCVWLDLAKDHQQVPLLGVIEELIRQKQVDLLLPRTVVDEFARNKQRIAEESGRSLSGVVKRVKEAVTKFGDPRQKRIVLKHLDEVDHKIPLLSDTAADTIARIEKLFAATKVIELSDNVKLRAAQRAIDRRAPFHRPRNGMDDAILIETYADCIKAKDATGARFAFVTHNTKDFSHPAANNNLPHPDLAQYFSKIKSLYFITLGQALKRIDPVQHADIIVEHEWLEEPRRLTEIVEAIDELVTKVWYNRHQVRKGAIEDGRTKLVEKETFPVKDHTTRPIQRDIWEGALKAAAGVEKRFGLEN